MVLKHRSFIRRVIVSEKEKPNPGSLEARKAGCKCPVLDNEYGRGSGRTGTAGQPQFWINQECLLHGKVET